MAQQLDDLKLTEAQAEAIIEKAIEHGAYDSDMPDTKKEKVAAAEETVAFAVDAWTNDNIRPDDEDPEVAKSGQQLQDLMDLAGVEVDDDGNIVYGDPIASEDEDADDEQDADDADDEDEGEDEEPFNPNDYIEGYTELSVVSKLKKVKSLDANDDDDAAVLEAIADWENEQEKPSSRILNYIDEALGTEDEQVEDEPEADTENGDEEPEAEADEDDGEEPWDGYDKATATQIKTVLTEAAADPDEPLTREQIEYVLEYEEARKAPRKRVIDQCNALLEQIDQGDTVADEPVAEADVEASNGVVITLTRKQVEQILNTLGAGEVTFKVKA